MSSNEPRDQLAEFLGDSVPPIHMAASRALEKMYGEWGITPGLPTPAVAVHRMADFLAEEGWRPPPRVIETTDLDALPVGSVVLHSPCGDSMSCVWVKYSAEDWATDGGEQIYDVDDIDGHLSYGGTLTVLHEPEEAR